MQLIKYFFLAIVLFTTGSFSKAQKPNYTNYNIMDGLPSNEVYHILQDRKGCIWFATNKGVCRYDGEDFKIFDINDGLPDNTIFEIYQDYKGRIWFISSSLKLSYYYQGKIHLYKHNDKLIDGFYKNRGHNQLTFYVDSHDNVFIGMRKFGILKIDSFGRTQRIPQKKIKLNGPEIFIESVKIHGKDTAVKDSHVLDLSYDKDYITIDYVGLPYKDKGDARYKYRMMGLDTSWHYTNSTTKSFTNLSPGKYKFLVTAENEEGIWSESPATISFSISKPYWKTWWFISLILIIIGGTIFAIVTLRLNMIRKRNELVNDINEYKQKVLRQQMNPHFIFNTLNSIQYFLLDEDTTSSLTYLTKFAKMMRIVLDNSQHTFVPIEDEIRGLDLYLELEALRFEDSFDYDIQIDNNINTFEYKIPALLLQPYVENSIRHGLLHKKGKGLLSISLKLEENTLCFVIKDNGIGRKRAEEIKENRNILNQSLGSKITEDRIKVLNSLYSDEIDINYTDLVDSEDRPAGTKVEIRLPFIH